MTATNRLPGTYRLPGQPDPATTHRYVIQHKGMWVHDWVPRTYAHTLQDAQALVGTLESTEGISTDYAQKRYRNGFVYRVVDQTTGRQVGDTTLPGPDRP